MAKKTKSKLVIKERNFQKENLEELRNYLTQLIEDGNSLSISFSLYKNKDNNLNKFVKKLKSFSRKKKKNFDMNRLNTLEEEEFFKKEPFVVNYNSKDEKENNISHCLNTFYNVEELFNMNKKKNLNKKNLVKKNISMKEEENNDDVIQDLIIENFQKLPKEIQDNLKKDIPQITQQEVQIIENLNY